MATATAAASRAVGLPTLRLVRVGADLDFGVLLTLVTLTAFFLAGALEAEEGETPLTVALEAAVSLRLSCGLAAMGGGVFLKDFKATKSLNHRVALFEIQATNH